MSEAAPQLTDLFSTPTPRTLAEVHNDLQTLMSEYKKNAPERYEQAAQMFPKHPEARTNIQTAEELLAKVKELAAPASTPANLTFPAPQTTEAAPVQPNPVQAAPQATAAEPAPAPAPVPAPVPATVSEPEPVEPEPIEPDPIEPEPVEPDPIPETPEQDPETDEEVEDRPEDEEEQEEGETEDDEGEQPTAQHAAPQPEAATVLSEVKWPAGALGSGILSQLAQTLGSGDTLQLIVVRKGDELLVTVDPKPIAGETAATAIALQVKGTPAALDTQMVSKLAEFKAGRDVAREEVNYAAQVKAAAEAARKSAEAARKASTSATTKKPAAGTQPGTLTLEVAPKNAIVTLTDEKSQTHPCKINGDTSLPAGVYTITVDAEGFTHHEEKITIRGGAKSKKGIVLKREEVAGLF